MPFMAKQFPRNQIQAADRILNACTRQTLADSAVYVTARRMNVEGVHQSDWLEVLAQNWESLILVSANHLKKTASIMKPGFSDRNQRPR